MLILNYVLFSITERLVLCVVLMLQKQNATFGCFDKPIMIHFNLTTIITER